MKLLVVECAVLVGLHDEVFDRGSELVVLEPFGLGDEQGSEVSELVPGTRMLLGCCHCVDLAGCDATVGEHVSNVGVLVEQSGASFDAECVGPGAVQLLLQVGLDCRLGMFLEQLSGVDHGGDGCDVDVGFVTLTFRRGQGRVELGDVGVCQLLDPCCEHTPDCAAAKPTDIAV